MAEQLPVDKQRSEMTKSAAEKMEAVAVNAESLVYAGEGNVPVVPLAIALAILEESERENIRLKGNLTEARRQIAGCKKERAEAQESRCPLHDARRLYEFVCEERGIRGKTCADCQGWGVRSYPSTATWRGGIGGQMFTSDVCDKCWGSGDITNPWLNLRQLPAPPEPSEVK